MSGTLRSTDIREQNSPSTVNMTRNPIAAVFLLALTFATSLSAHGDFWDFLGSTPIDRGQDHEDIQVTRHDGAFRALQLRVSGEAIFFDRFIIHFADGSSQQVPVSSRIAAQGQNYVIELPEERRVVDSLELWYYNETWKDNPRVTLYGTR